MPSGWNLLPLLLMGLITAALWNTSETNDPKRAGTSSRGDTAAETEDTTSDHRQGRELADRLNRSFGPIAAGLIIDAVDFATFGPIGLVLGLPAGGLAGYWMGRSLGLDRRASAWCALAAGVYCTIPGTEFIPLATIIGAFSRFRDSGKATPAR